VIKVEVPWRDQRQGAQFCIELSHWLTEQGLIRSVDYHWHFMPAEKIAVFYFEDRVESYATLFQLRWAGNEI